MLSDYYRTYDLQRARTEAPTRREPAAHQAEALVRLRQWYEAEKADNRGGLLVLPTGGGKTYTAVRFLCTAPLSDGSKVLWLAHTHHLLEQAIESFGPSIAGPDGAEVSKILEPRENLAVRVVSGTPGHFPVHKIERADDVLIITLQTAARALARNHEKLLEFIESAGGKLFVVFDEAHHAPAPSYAKFISRLRELVPNLHLLGLTATPIYTDSKRAGWLNQLFPQGILYQVAPTRLMAERILARPRIEEPRTRFTPRMAPSTYQRWVNTYQDLPEGVISQLAENQERNDCIVATYVEEREKYGKTIMFADRWYQCDYLRERLLAHKVRADVVYSHVDADPGTAEARNRRTRDENARVLEAFRRGELDVLINVRMLTEGTDVPNVQSVFLTRQTTSPVLLTQMVGRALRGPAFGGTPEAYIVAFIDDWKEAIQWAGFEMLSGGLDVEGVAGKRPPLQLISIELLRRLARAMQEGVVASAAPFTSLLPIGWYQVEYQAAIADSDDAEWIRHLVLVYEHEKAGFQRLFEKLGGLPLEKFGEEEVDLEAAAQLAAEWRNEFFGDGERRVGKSFDLELVHVLRHFAQQLEPPAYFPFEQREAHDLDAIAKQHIEASFSLMHVEQALRAEYERTDRFWRALYQNYSAFNAQYQQALRRAFDLRASGGTVDAVAITGRQQPIPAREPSEEVKEAVKRRDGRRCLCCGDTRRLEIDHIVAAYHGGDADMQNLQTLCRVCNRDKNIRELNFRIHRTPHRLAPKFALLDAPRPDQVRDIAAWERYVRRTLNFFYGCAAVDRVDIGQRGPRFYQWQVTLYPGNDANWFVPDYEKLLLERIRDLRSAEGLGSPERIIVSGVG